MLIPEGLLLGTGLTWSSPVEEKPSVYLFCYFRRRRRWCFHFGLFVCLFVCLSDNWKSCERILTKFLGGVGHGPGTKWLNFGDDLGHRREPGVRSLKSGFTGLSKKYLVDSDQSCIANLHCKNHSAILWCWCLSDVCVLCMLLVHHCVIVKIFQKLDNAVGGHQHLQGSSSGFVVHHYAGKVDSFCSVL